MQQRLNNFVDSITTQGLIDNKTKNSWFHTIQGQLGFIFYPKFTNLAIRKELLCLPTMPWQRTSHALYTSSYNPIWPNPLHIVWTPQTSLTNYGGCQYCHLTAFKWTSMSPCSIPTSHTMKVLEHVRNIQTHKTSWQPQQLTCALVVFVNNGFQMVR